MNDLAHWSQTKSFSPVAIFKCFWRAPEEQNDFIQRNSCNASLLHEFLIELERTLDWTKALRQCQNLCGFSKECSFKCACKYILELKELEQNLFFLLHAVINAPSKHTNGWKTWDIENSYGASMQHERSCSLEDFLTDGILFPIVNIWRVSPQNAPANGFSGDLN